MDTSIGGVNENERFPLKKKEEKARPDLKEVIAGAFERKKLQGKMTSEIPKEKPEKHQDYWGVK